MTVRQLRERLEHLPSGMPVVMRIVEPYDEPAILEEEVEVALVQVQQREQGKTMVVMLQAK